MKNYWRISRRAVLRSFVGGSLLFPAILSELLAAGERRQTGDPLAPKEPHFAPKAKRVIFLFSTGGVSHMDTFDYKPRLINAPSGMTVPGGGLSLERRPALRPRWRFRRGGECGTLVSDLFPHLRDRMDDICLINSMTTDNNEHFQATLAIHTGSFFQTRPSMGSWISYGLGTVNRNLPSFVVLAPHLPYAGTQVFNNDFLPAYHQGTRVVPGSDPIPNLRRPGRNSNDRVATNVQQLELGFARRLNQRHLKNNGHDSELAARMRTFETAYQMQFEAPQVFDLSRETNETLQLYGLNRRDTQSFAWQCLVARRLVEHGVRYVELIDSGSSGNWDSHGDMGQHEPLARKIDRPIAALIHDLKRRGMLDDTLVIWTTEFGRTPGKDGNRGRGHHPAVYSSWLAGGGAKGGMVYGKSDDIGATVAANPVHVHDFHATILHLLGFDHERLTYRHAGRDFRLTDVYGNVVRDILAG